jgi:hypothetical protein
MRRALSLTVLLGLLLSLVGTTPAGSADVAPAPEGANSVSGASFQNAHFESVWSRTDGPVASGAVSRSWLWGPAPGETRQEPFAGAPGGVRTVQYFDKARMESNPAVTDPNNPWSVTTGLLVVEMASGQVQTGPASTEKLAPAEIAVAGDILPGPLDTAPRYASFRQVASLPGTTGRSVPDAGGMEVRATIDKAGKVGTLSGEPPARVRYAAYTPETGHNIPDVFARFMEQEGPVLVEGKMARGRLFDPVYLLGHPITEAYWTTVPIGGKAEQVLVQLYQRRVLTFLPSYGEGWQVQMGNVGQHYFGWRYANEPPPLPKDALLVRPAGNKLVIDGKPVVLKGTNYWYHKAPFGDTWIWWDGPAIRHELWKAKELGANTVRIGIPFGERRATKTIWGPDCEDDRGLTCTEVKGRIVSQMNQFLQIAAGFDMKVIFTLFEWHNQYPAPNERAYARQLNYLRGLVRPFANDDRVLAWDLHNEPEYYATWKDGGKDRVIAWIGHMARALREIDRNHMLTIGVARYETLWDAARDGTRLIDMVDLVSFHLYDAGALRTQIIALEKLTHKPLLLEEMGWPTGPAELSTAAARYDEATQLFLYRTMLADAKSSSLVGVVQWMLWDYPHDYGLYPGDPPTFEPFFGIVRVDGSFKPAAAEFRDGYPVSPLPSRTKTNVPLTRQQGD